MTCCCLPLSFQLVVLALQLTCCCGTVSEHEHHKTELIHAQNPHTGYAEILISFTQIERRICSLRPSINERVVLMGLCVCEAGITLHCCQNNADRCSVYQAGMMTVTVYVFHSSVLRFKACLLFCDYFVLLGELQVKLQKYARHLIQTNRRETMISLMLNCICSVAALYLLIFCMRMSKGFGLRVSKQSPASGLASFSGINLLPKWLL